MPAIPARWAHVLRPLLVLLVLGSVAWAARPAQAADGVVGTGSPATCTEAAFDTVFGSVQGSGGGVITFNCGPKPHTIIFTAPKFVSASTELRGDNRITLSGGNATSLFQVFAGQTFTVRTIALVRANGAYGAIESFGQLVVRDASFLDNGATVAGGAILAHGAVDIEGALFSGNQAVQYGAGLFVESGSASVRDTRFISNTVTDQGGGIAVNALATLTLTGSEFRQNQTTAVFAEGAGLWSAGTTAITDTVFVQNNASRGGGLFVDEGATTVVQSRFTGNVAAYGGGLRQEGGTLALLDVTVAGNGYAANGTRVTTGGGGLSWGDGTATLTNVTISGNWASYGGGLDHVNGATTLTNVTISGNASVDSGGIDQSGGVINLVNVTLADNSTMFTGGGVSLRNGTLVLKNTLLTNNRNAQTNQSANCNKALPGATFSLSSDFTCGMGAGRDNVPLVLGPLANNGGFTPTRLLGPGSPALDAGTGSGCPATDQRGVARPQGQACDIGAVEIAASDLLYRTYLPVAEK